MASRFSPPSLAALQRPDPSRAPRKAILIATEDAKSSRLYFDDLEMHLRTHRIVVLAPHRGSAPKSVVDAAAEQQEDFDETWVVFDTEGPGNSVRMTDARNAIQRAKDLSMRTAVSNPSFEFWIALHFERYEKTLANGHAALRLAQRLFAKYENGFVYDKGVKVFDILHERTEVAIKNARYLFKHRYADSHHPCDCHPCTEMYLLVESLLSEE